jgi:hypothetical protein
MIIGKREPEVEVGWGYQNWLGTDYRMRYALCVKR